MIITYIHCLYHVLEVWKDEVMHLKSYLDTLLDIWKPVVSNSNSYKFVNLLCIVPILEYVLPKGARQLQVWISHQVFWK